MTKRLVVKTIKIIKDLNDRNKSIIINKTSQQPRKTKARMILVTIKQDYKTRTSEQQSSFLDFISIIIIIIIKP